MLNLFLVLSSLLLMLCDGQNLRVLQAEETQNYQDSFPDFIQFITPLNYPVESHDVTTEDGYICTFFRIQAKNQGSFKQGLPVVYIQHGLFDSADSWILNDEPNAPALQLANNGYDVWLANSRGNKYCRKHTVYNLSNPEFWQFSWQNMSHYDLPAGFEYINQQTGQLINYVGHSQGTTMMFAALSDGEPTVLKYLKTYVALAPSAFENHTNSHKNIPEFNAIYNLLESKHVYDVLPANFFESDAFHILCNSYPSQCADVFKTLFGSDPTVDNYALIPLLMEHEPCGTSLMNVGHWKQQIDTGNYSKFDYGAEGNMLHYNQTYPPPFNLTNIQFPIYMFIGSYDTLADPTDIQTLTSRLTNCNITAKVVPASHMSYVIANNMSFYFDDLLQILENSNLIEI